jgi:opacity protein-like surface antigen
MKKLIFTLSFCCLGLMAQAQSIKTGLKAGLNLGSARVQEIQQDWESDGLTTGVHAGLFARFQLGPLYVQPEAYYTFTQAKIRRENDQITQDFERLGIDFHRLDVPVLLGFKIARILRLNAGPFATVLLNTSANSDHPTNREEIENAAQDLYSRANWGWQAGLGVDVLMLTLDARYETTVGDLSSHDFTSTNPLHYLPRGQQQQQFIISLGYKF